MNNKSLVVITGASQGIGRALAHRFAKAGNPLLLISRHIETLVELEGFENVLYEQVNVTDNQALEISIRKAEALYGETECLINNAGFINIGSFSEMAIEKIHTEMDVLLKGVINGIKAVLPKMQARKSGTIINMSSIGDRRPSGEAVMYHASKHAVLSLSENLQQAEAQHNVRVINIAPGLVKTNIHTHMGMSFEEYSTLFGNPIFLKSEEVADIVYFCWSQPQHICIRDLVVMPTSCGY
jgi:NADP-dependent 3-hydroxy acid dehydrogenase YdfG